MPAPDDTIYLVLEFPNASEKHRFLDNVKVHRFTQMKQMEEKFKLSHYVIKNCLAKKDSLGTGHLYMEKIVYGDVQQSPVCVLSSAPGLFKPKTEADFILSFD
jgi:hypothetical protein